MTSFLIFISYLMGPLCAYWCANQWIVEGATSIQLIHDPNHPLRSRWLARYLIHSLPIISLISFLYIIGEHAIVIMTQERYNHNLY